MNPDTQSAPRPDWPPIHAETPLAVLVSGGLDSAILVGEAIRAYPCVRPIYVRTGSAWEAIERDYLTRFLAALHNPRVHPLLILDQPTGDIYGDHEAVRHSGPDTRAMSDGHCVPPADAPRPRSAPPESPAARPVG